jgi:ABC-type bacteriocin/lantibiotic exporter with double-glycine peptidase domain
MHTIINEGSSTISGGQKQRLLIARTLIHKPSIIIFDEATSALDNRTQSIITESLNKLQATRIVIAHRLSTIKDVDKIFVFDKGKIVQEGTFDDLMEAEGLFKVLALRQME